MEQGTQQQFNIAFVDGQNLHLGTTKDTSPWQVDYQRLRIYLKNKYNVSEAYYFLGFLDENLDDLYTNLQKAGFIVEFREHNAKMKGKKKGNVDVDIVFGVMKKLIDEADSFNKIVLVSNDGDYIRLVNYLIKKDKLAKIIFPNNKPSSLYKKIDVQFKNYLAHSRGKIEKK